MTSMPLQKSVSAPNDIVSKPGKTVAVTCHGGVVNVWAAHVLGLPSKMFFNPYYTRPSISRRQFGVSSQSLP